MIWPILNFLVGVIVVCCLILAWVLVVTLTANLSHWLLRVLS